MGQIRGNLAWDDKTIALSPDGQLLAGKPTFRNVIEVRSTKTGRVTKSIDLKSPFLDFVDFGPEGSIL
ncbi:hypothetical protein OFC63_33930, partial [Escherichia coli]|nr:hypothetical protein [Escherichia coli]